MNKNRKEHLRLWQLALLVLLAVAIGPVVVLSFIAIMSLPAGRIPDLSDEVSILAIQAGMVSFPFFVIAILGTTNKMPWLVGIFLTIALWGYMLYDVLFNPWRGANIGLGLLLLAAPIFITIACVVAAWQSESPDT